MLGIYLKIDNLRWLFFIPFILTLCTVFSDSNYLEYGNISAKYFWFYSSMALVIPIIPFLKPKIKYNWADIFAFLVLTSIACVCLFSGFPVNKTKLLLLLLLFVLYFQLRSFLVSQPRALEVFVFCLILISLIECIEGIRQLYGFSHSNHPLYKMTGSFFNPGPYAGFVGTIFPIALHHAILFIKVESRKRFILTQLIKGNLYNTFRRNLFICTSYLLGLLSTVTVFCSILVLPTAMSRASWIGVMIGSTFVFLNHFPSKKFLKNILPTRRMWILASVCLLFILTFIFFGLYYLKKESVDGRFFLWKICTKAMIAYPSGVGIGNFGGIVGETQSIYYSKGLASQSEIDLGDVPIHAFNEFLQIGVESGVVTLLLFIMLVILTIRNAIHFSRYHILGALISLITFSFFSYPFDVLPLLIVFIFLLSLNNSNCDRQLKRAAKRAPTLKKWFKYIGNIVSMCLIIFVLIDRFPTYKAFRAWNSYKLRINAGLFADVWKEMGSIYPYLDDNVNYLFDYAYTLSRTGHYLESNRVLIRVMSMSGDPMLLIIYGKNCKALNDIDKAETAFYKAYYLSPKRIYPLYLLSKLYFESGRANEAKKTALIALNHKIVVPSKAIDEIKDSLRGILISVSIE